MTILRTVVFAALLATLAAALGAQTPRPRITGISHLSVYTTAAEKAEQFYVHDLGAVKRSDPQNPAGRRFYFSPVQFVEVLPLPAVAPAKLRLDHAGYNTVNAEQIRLYLREHHVDVPDAVTKASDGSQYVEVKDPEGNPVEFVQPPVRPEAVPVNALSTRMIHVGYLVHSQAAEDTFYRNILGFRPYWHGGPTEGETAWVSLQVPDGQDWLEYMLVKGPETSGIPAVMTQDSAGVLDHFSLGVSNMEQSVTQLYNGDRLTARHSQAQIGRDGKWQYNLFDPDGIRVELMEFQPVGKPCCSAFLAPSPTR